MTNRKRLSKREGGRGPSSCDPSFPTETRPAPRLGQGPCGLGRGGCRVQTGVGSEPPGRPAASSVRSQRAGRAFWAHATHNHLSSPALTPTLSVPTALDRVTKIMASVYFLIEELLLHPTPPERNSPRVRRRQSKAHRARRRPGPRGRSGRRRGEPQRQPGGLSGQRPERGGKSPPLTPGGELWGPITLECPATAGGPLWPRHLGTGGGGRVGKGVQEAKTPGPGGHVNCAGPLTPQRPEAPRDGLEGREGPAAAGGRSSGGAPGATRTRGGN